VEDEDATPGHCRELVEKFPVTWIDISGLDDKLALEFETLFGFHHLALEDAMHTVQEAKVEPYDNFAYIVTKLINWAEEIRTAQLSIFIAKNFVMTVHDGPITEIENLKVRLRKKSPRLVKGGADYLCYSILDSIVDSYLPHLDHFSDVLDELEDQIVEKPDRTTIRRSHDVKRDLLLIRNQLRPQRDAFAVLARGELPYFRKEVRNYLRDVYDHMIRTLDALDTYRDIAVNLLEVHAQLIANQLNEVIKVLTILFTLTIPMTVIAGFYGMNVGFPGRDSEIGFLSSLVLAFGLTGAVIVYMRMKKLF